MWWRRRRRRGGDGGVIGRGGEGEEMVVDKEVLVVLGGGDEVEEEVRLSGEAEDKRYKCGLRCVCSQVWTFTLVHINIICYAFRKLIAFFNHLIL